MKFFFILSLTALTSFAIAQSSDPTSSPTMGSPSATGASENMDSSGTMNTQGSETMDSSDSRVNPSKTTEQQRMEDEQQKMEDDNAASDINSDDSTDLNSPSAAPSDTSTSPSTAPSTSP